MDVYMARRSSVLKRILPSPLSILPEIIWDSFLHKLWYCYSLEFFLFYPVRLIVSNQENFIQCGDFYAVRRLFYSVETYIQCGDFYAVERLLSVEIFIQCEDFFSV